MTEAFLDTNILLRHLNGVSKAKIAENLLPLLQLPGIVLPKKRRYRKVFSLRC
jgi:hypothetical protein